MCKKVQYASLVKLAYLFKKFERFLNGTHKNNICKFFFYFVPNKLAH